MFALMLLAIAAPPETIAVDVRGAACALERRLDEPLGALGLRRVPRGRPAQLRLRVDIGAARVELVLARAGQPEVRRSLPRAASCAADVDAIGWVLEAQLRDLGFTPPPRLELTPAPSLTPAIPPRSVGTVAPRAGAQTGVAPDAGPSAGAAPRAGAGPSAGAGPRAGAGPPAGVAPGDGPAPGARAPELGGTSSVAETRGLPGPEPRATEPPAGRTSSVATAAEPTTRPGSAPAAELAPPAPQSSPAPPRERTRAAAADAATTEAPEPRDEQPAPARAPSADTTSLARDPRTTDTASTGPGAWTLRAAALALVETGPSTVPGVELRARLAERHGLFADLGVGWRASRGVDVVAGDETRGTLTLTRFALLAGAGLEWGLGPGAAWASLSGGADLAWATSQGPLLFRTTSAVRAQPVLGGELGYTLDLSLGPLRGLVASAALVARPGTAKFTVEGGTGTLEVPDWSATFRLGAWLGVP